MYGIAVHLLAAQATCGAQRHSVRHILSASALAALLPCAVKQGHQRRRALPDVQCANALCAPTFHSPAQTHTQRKGTQIQQQRKEQKQTFRTDGKESVRSDDTPWEGVCTRRSSSLRTPTAGKDCTVRGRPHLGSVQLVPSHGEHIHTQLIHAHRKLANRLRGVCVHKNALVRECSLHSTSDIRDRAQCASFVLRAQYAAASVYLQPVKHGLRK